MCGVVSSARERMAPSGGAFLGTFTAPTPPCRRRSKTRAAASWYHQLSAVALVWSNIAGGRRKGWSHSRVSGRLECGVARSPPERSGFHPGSNGPGKEGGPQLPSGSQWRNYRRACPAGTGPESRFQQTVKRSFLGKHQAQASSHPADLGPRIRSPTQWEDRRYDELSVVTC